MGELIARDLLIVVVLSLQDFFRTAVQSVVNAEKLLNVSPLLVSCLGGLVNVAFALARIESVGDFFAFAIATAFFTSRFASL